MKSKYTFSLYLKLGKGPSPFDSDTRQHILYCTNRDGERCNIDVRVKVVAEQGKFLTLMSRSKIYPVFATTTFTPRKKSLCVCVFFMWGLHLLVHFYFYFYIYGTGGFLPTQVRREHILRFVFICRPSDVTQSQFNLGSPSAYTRARPPKNFSPPAQQLSVPLASVSLPFFSAMMEVRLRAAVRRAHAFQFHSARRESPNRFALSKDRHN